VTVSGLLFMIVFLPVSLGLYYISTDRAKEYVLLAVSLFFYAVGSADYFVLFVFSVFMTVILGRSISRTEKTALRKLFLVLGILLNVSFLGFFKYYAPAVDLLNSSFNAGITLKNYALPLGISVYCFKAISYLCDVYNRKVELSAEPVHDALYMSFFAQIQSGPMSRYSELTRVETDARRELFFEGVYRFLVGFNKKILLSGMLVRVSSEVFNAPADKTSTSFVWLGALCNVLQLYFDFSGYSDMAIGISGMFGYRCMENFNYPFMSKSVGEFWRRWHISLGMWFKDYIYIPMGGSRTKYKIGVYFNLLVVWILTGIWHGTSKSYIFWGIGCFLAIAFERLTGYPKKFKSKIMKEIYRLFVDFYFGLTLVIFTTAETGGLVNFLKKMFIPTGNTFGDARANILLNEYLVFIIIGIVMCFPIVPYFNKKFEGEDNKVKKTVFDTVVGVLTITFFVLAISMVSGGFSNPFAYANF